MNPKAGSCDSLEELLSTAELTDGVEWRETNGHGDATMLAKQAADEGFEIVAAAGGDGTINEVVNGLVQASRTPVLGIIPLGTGNDLARMLALPTDPVEALSVIRQGDRHRLDLYRMRSASHDVYGINVSAGGFSGQVNEAMTPEMKASWGPLAYLFGAAAVLSDRHSYDVYLSLDDQAPEIINVINIIVANGRTAAGGRRVAPYANPEDGLLNVLIVRNGSMVELGDAATRLVTGGFANSKIVDHRLARTVHVESEPGMWFNVDGELITNEPIKISVQPGALEVIVGPEYVASPEV